MPAEVSPAALTVQCLTVEPSSCMGDDDGAVDASLRVAFDGEVRKCEVTLVPDRGRLAVYGGSRDCWADDAMLNALRAWEEGTDAEGWDRQIGDMIAEVEGEVTAAFKRQAAAA